MFLRSVKAANGRHEYLRLVENYREGDKVRQRVVVHVGRKDLLALHLGLHRAGGRPARLDLALLEVRPVHHRKEERVRAHVFVAALAFLLDRALEKKLRAAGSPLSSPAAWQALETVRCVAVEVGARTKLCVTRGSRHAAEVLKILKLSELDPPQPPEGRETVM